MNKMETQTPPQLTNLSASSRRLNRRAFLGRMATGAALLAPAAGVLDLPLTAQADLSLSQPI